jgi:hypothetical protein
MGGGGERGRERCRICPELLFLFLKGITGALAPFSYLVSKSTSTYNYKINKHRVLLN